MSEHKDRVAEARRLVDTEQGFNTARGVILPLCDSIESLQAEVTRHNDIQIDPNAPPLGIVVYGPSPIKRVIEAAIQVVEDAEIYHDLHPGLDNEAAVIRLREVLIQEGFWEE